MRCIALRQALLAARFGAALVALGSALGVAGATTREIGLAADGSLIAGVEIEAGDPAAPTVLLIGGLAEDGSTHVVESAVREYERRPARRRDLNVVAIARANPASALLEFPPTGAAYRDHPESHALWRFVATLAPDLVLVSGEDGGLLAALGATAPAGVGRVPARQWRAGEELAALGAARIAPSAASLEVARRAARPPRAVAEELGAVYGHDFAQPTYINALALVARARLGALDDVRRLVEPYVDGRQDSLARPNSLTMAGHVVFTELARATGDSRYVDAVRRVANLGFDDGGAMRESMPYHGEFSDSIFMGATIAAQAGALTGERKYFDLAVRHIAFMQRLVLRPDGLYRHQPSTDAAWGRGNAFAAIGLALTLDELPETYEGRTAVLASYRSHMAALLRLQTPQGLWRNVVDHPGAYGEYSATAMIAFAMQRGLERGWLEGVPPYRAAVDEAWRAINARTGSDGTLIDVCESTARIESLEGYLRREALLGPDPRGGAMAMLLATELMN